MKRGTDDRQFFKLAVLPSSVIAGLLFNLQYVFAFIKTLIAGNAFNLFTFANPDALIFYFPLVRAAYDGGSRIVDGRILENFFLPNLWTQLSPILIAPLWRLAGSPSFAWMLGVFIMAVGAFICFYFLCRQIIGHRIFSLLYSFIFISVTLVFNYLFPTSLENLKLAGRVILPFGSPAADVLLSKYISFSVLPGFLLFVASFLLILMALIRKRKIFIILAGFCAGILPYIQITFFVYVFAVLFCALLLFLLYKEYISAKRIIWICVVAGLASAFYWFNFLQIKMLPWTDEFYKRLGGEITHQFRWSHWSEYLAYAIMGWLVLRWGNKTRKRAEAIFVAGAVLAALGVTNMQVVTGFNPIFSVWSNHNIFLGFALGWLVLIYWIYTGLSKKFDKRIVGAAFLVLFLMTMGKFIYMAYCVGNNFSKYDLMPKGIYAPLEWLSANTERDSVVATPSLTTNALLPFYTHNNSMLPLAFTSPMSLEDVRDRYFVAYKFFNVSADYFKKALEGKLSAAGSIGFENNLWGFLIADYYCDHSLGAFEKPGACFTADSSAAIEKTAGDYAAYPSRREYLLNKYRIDYIFYGPDEKIMGKPDFTGFEKVYDKDGYEIYKRGVM
jgi:hypothetical protein